VLVHAIAAAPVQLAKTSQHVGRAERLQRRDVVGLLKGREAALELVATEGPAELRLAPNDDNGAPRFSF